MSRTGQNFSKNLHPSRQDAQVTKSLSLRPSGLEGSTKGIGINDIITSLNKQKIGTTYVQNQDKILVNKFSPDKGKRDFISFVQKQNNFKISPGQYNPSNVHGFLGDKHTKQIHFAYNRE